MPTANREEHFLERVPLRTALLSVAADHLRHLFTDASTVADPVPLALAPYEADVAILVAPPGYGKTVTLQRAAARFSGEVLPGGSRGLVQSARAISAPALLIDDLGPDAAEVERIAEILGNSRTPVVTVTEPEGLSRLLAALRRRSRNAAARSLRLRTIELLPWEVYQLRDMIRLRLAGCTEPKARIRLGALEGLLDSGRLTAVYGELVSCPLFLRLILDLVEIAGLPTGRVDRAWLVREWVERHADSEDEELTAKIYRVAGLPSGLPEASSEPERDAAPVSRRRIFKLPAHRQEPVSPPDLEIRVALETEAGAHRLRYILDARTGPVTFFHRSLPGPLLDRHPEDYATLLRERIEGLGRQTGIDGSLLLPHEIRRELDNIGRELYDRLFPPEMRRAYRSFRRTVRTLLIVSDEPWIPWEWIRPYDDSDRSEVIDDDFFCLRFCLARWLAGGNPPAETIHAERIALIEAGEVPGTPPLPHAAAERRWLARLAERHGVAAFETPAATHPQVVARLAEGGIGLFHFVGHGQLGLAKPESSRFLLADGRPLRPLDLRGPLQTRLQEARPLVFFNACETTQQDWGPTGLDGWVPQWIRGCGCGALIGPQWRVGDRLALRFAQAFYTRLERGRTFGQAARAARRALRRIDSDNPSWLAFTLYAHPNGRLHLGSSTEPRE